MNITERILHDPKHPVSDVRVTSMGADYPFSTVLRMTSCGVVYWEGFHPGKGMYTGLWRTTPAEAVADIKLMVPRRCYE